MNGKRIIMSTFFLAYLASACATMTAAQRFRESSGLERASFDLDCPKEQLNVVTLGKHTMQVGVTGCGKRAVYVGTNRGWVLNSETSKQPSDDDKQAP